MKVLNDERTQVVYFSALLPERFPGEFTRIKAILDKYDIECRYLKETKDIWCRDYMPIQLSENEFIQFRYEPSYLQTDEDLKHQSDPKRVNEANGFNPGYSRINLDGGNVVRYQDKVMISARVYAENKDLGLSKEEIRAQLGKDLKARVIIIPEHPGDKIDHADGNVRFLDDSNVLINELQNEYKYWREGMERIKKENGFSFIEVPWFIPKKKKDSLSALGLYINFLDVGNLILLPKFEIEGNRDEEALNRFKNIYPTRNIEQVNINAIAEEGGLLNCITWDIIPR
jgi:agmatine deiminase